MKGSEKMSKELLNEINDYLYFIKAYGINQKLVSYEEVNYNDINYINIYEGGNYVYDEINNKYYKCYFEDIK